MRVIVYDNDGVRREMPQPVQAKVTNEMYGASSFTCTIPIEEHVPGFASVRVYNGEQLLFYGTIDKQTLSFSNSGRLLKLTARDFSALLLDSEAGPQIYEICSFADIYGTNVSRHGIGNGVASNPVYSSAFTITKGFSDFETVEKFCRFTGLGRPFVDTDKKLKLREFSGNVFFDGADRDIFYADWSVLRHKPITNVLLMQPETMRYSYLVSNYSGAAVGLRRLRLKNYSALSFEERKREAERLMAVSRAGSREYTVKFVGLDPLRIGCGAGINYGGIGASGLTVVKTELIEDNSGIYTVVTLWPRADVY